MILSAQTIRALKPIEPFCERSIAHGMSYGLGPNGYDIRIAEDLIIPARSYALASSIEYFTIPRTVAARVTDKSTWARRFLSVFNTTIDANWSGYLTLELVNHSDQSIMIHYGSPIAKIIFEALDAPTEIGYNGIYQNQRSGPVEAAVQVAAHAIRQECDEYACMCGARWAVSEGEEHP